MTKFVSKNVLVFDELAGVVVRATVGECFQHGKYAKLAKYSFTCPFCAIEAESKEDLYGDDCPVMETESALWSSEFILDDYMSHYCP